MHVHRSEAISSAQECLAATPFRRLRTAARRPNRPVSSVLSRRRRSAGGRTCPVKHVEAIFQESSDIYMYNTRLHSFFYFPASVHLQQRSIHVYYCVFTHIYYNISLCVCSVMLIWYRLNSRRRSLRFVFLQPRANDAEQTY